MSVGLSRVHVYSRDRPLAEDRSAGVLSFCLLSEMFKNPYGEDGENFTSFRVASDPTYRPDIEKNIVENVHNAPLLQLITRCWAFVASERPTWKEICFILEL